MNIRPEALQWLKKEHGVNTGILCTSKFYVPEKSRTHKSAWWLEVDRSKIEMSSSQMLHFICEKAPGINDFHYLRLPSGYLIENQNRLDIRHDKNRFSMFLSAEQENLFQDERGEGKVQFGQFLV